jgi:hypothetical protein
LDAGAAVAALECDRETPYGRGEGVYDDGLATVQEGRQLWIAPDQAAAYLVSLDDAQASSVGRRPRGPSGALSRTETGGIPQPSRRAGAGSIARFSALRSKELAMPRCPSSSQGHLVRAAVAVMAIASAITLASATAPSTASAAAWNNGTVYMHADPVPPNVGTACVERRIWLKRGRYRWKMYLAVNNRPDLVTAWTRYIDLRAGWYRWKDCLGAPTGDYQQCSMRWAARRSRSASSPATAKVIRPVPARAASGSMKSVACVEIGYRDTGDEVGDRALHACDHLGWRWLVLAADQTQQPYGGG